MKNYRTRNQCRPLTLLQEKEHKESAARHEINKTKNIIDSMIKNNRINSFADRNGMMKEFHVNCFKIESDGKNYKINGESISDIPLSRLTRIREIISQD